MTSTSTNWETATADCGLFYKLGETHFETTERSKLYCRSLEQGVKEATIIADALKDPEFARRFNERLKVLVGAYLTAEGDRKSRWVFIREADRLAGLIIISRVPLYSKTRTSLCDFVPDCVSRVFEGHRGCAIDLNWRERVSYFQRKGLPADTENYLHMGYGCWSLRWNDCHSPDEDRPTDWARYSVTWQDCLTVKTTLLSAYMQWEVVRAAEKACKTVVNIPKLKLPAITLVRSDDSLASSGSTDSLSSSNGSSSPVSPSRRKFSITPGRDPENGDQILSGAITSVHQKLDAGELTTALKVTGARITRLCEEVLNMASVLESIDKVMSQVFTKLPDSIKSAQQIKERLANKKKAFWVTRAAGCVIQLATVAPQIFPPPFIMELQKADVLCSA